MITVEEALARVLALATPMPVESVPLRRAAGRALAEDVVARRDQPPFAASAMDGYAVHGDDYRTGARLAIIGEAGAGHAFAGRIAPGQTARIFTGAPVPAGAARVVLQENVTRAGDTAILGVTEDAQTNIRALGQDFRIGSRLPAPRLLNARDLALIAAMNLPDVQVRRRPVVALVATGDELVMPGEDPGPDQIIASNTFALSAMAEAAGAEVRMLPIARDDVASLRMVLGMAQDADLVVTIGGASVGDHDLVGAVAADMGLERAFWKIAMRPGKPLMAGRMGDAVFLGLPGNPVSAIVCARLFLLPLLRAMQGLPPHEAALQAELGTDMPANGPRAHYMRAHLTLRDGLPLIMPFDQQDSALLTILSQADALLIRPLGDGPARAGDLVPYLPL